MSDHAVRALAEIWAGVGGMPDDLSAVEITCADPVLPSRFAVGTAAAATVSATTLAAARSWRDRGGPSAAVRVNTRSAAVAFRSERYVRVNGAVVLEHENLTGDYRTRDGWVRLHCNYPHHRDAAMRALGLAQDEVERVAPTVAGREAQEVEEAVIEAGGAAAALRTTEEWSAHPQWAAVAALPLVAIDQIHPSPARLLPPADRPLEGVRVLDLTRVIAGPVAGRTLAAHGAEVLRVGADHLPLVPSLVIDTGFGKRFCHVDLRSGAGRDRLTELVAGADVIVQSYRPGALARIGLGPAECSAIRPGLVYVDISAWGQAGPWQGRRGFDSLVQMACGIADEGRVAAGDPHGKPRPLPAQVLDHATGYLAALGALAGLRHRRTRGGSWHVQVSLARTASWLWSLHRVPNVLATADPALDDIADLLDEMATPFGLVRYVRPPGIIDGALPRWDTPPHAPGADPPTWLARGGHPRAGSGGTASDREYHL